MKMKPLSSLAARTVACALAAATLAGCAPLVVGGAAVGTALMVSDRRTAGTQVEDETIELRGASRMTEAFGDRAHVSIASYNRRVLLTGEVPSEAARQQAEQIASGIPNVKEVVNELAVMPPTTFGQRSNDTLITGKVRASFVDARELQANAFRVVTERGTVYLMGRVTQAEADHATQIARRVPGVLRVVRILEIVSPSEIRPAGSAQPATVAPN